MSERYVESSADGPANFAVRAPERHAVASHRDEEIEIELQDALAREEALLRQMAELTRQQGALSELLGSGENARTRIASLTLRERQIMLLVLNGHSNKSIAADIGIS